jgi:hypothetical protein
MAAQHDLEIYQGSDFSVQFQLKDALDQPIDLSTATIASQIRSYSGALLASFSVANSISGVTALVLPRSITANLPAERHRYNVVFRANAIEEVIVEGAVVVRPRITVTL